MSYDIVIMIFFMFDYWCVGLFLSYISYDKNLSGFMVGNGGYFSFS